MRNQIPKRIPMRLVCPAAGPPVRAGLTLGVLHLIKGLGLAALMTWSMTVAHAETIAIRTVDERGVAVVGAVVLVSWAVHLNDSVVTDREGRVRVHGSSPHGQAEIRIQAVGHYETNLSLPSPYNCVEGRCQIGTLDEVTVQIKRKVNPVPMYHYTIRALSPDASRPVGFDLERADWVEPYGKGVVADLTYFNVCTIRNVQRFQAPLPEQAVRASEAALGVVDRYIVARRQIVNGKATLLPGSQANAESRFPEPELMDGFEIYAARRSDMECQGEVRFDNRGDGLQFVSVTPPDRPKWMSVRSDLESAHLAPESGYQAVWSVSGRVPPQPQEPQVGYFRIRSKLDSAGRIASAWYGKIYSGNPHLAGAQRLILDYYLNPDGTRNVEYDPQRNLGRDRTNKP